MTEHLNLASGARLDYLVEGDGDALLVYHHGTPAAGPIPHDLITAAATHGFTLVELVRPGYGESTRQPGRSVADVVPLVEALADHLGHERFVTMGWSGGGPHAIATAALLPQRCAAALSLASVAPYGEGDLDARDVWFHPGGNLIAAVICTAVLVVAGIIALRTKPEHAL